MPKTETDKKMSLLKKRTNHDRLKESTPREAAWFLLESFVSGFETMTNDQKYKLTGAVESWLMKEAVK
jgi:hypothetical protein